MAGGYGLQLCPARNLSRGLGQLDLNQLSGLFEVMLSGPNYRNVGSARPRTNSQSLTNFCLKGHFKIALTNLNFIMSLSY